METSEQIDKLCAAVSAFQGEQLPVYKTAINNAFARGSSGGSKYATLADCAQSHTTLSKHGLAFMQGIHGTEFIARLVHASGQWMQLRVPVPGDFSKLTIQQLGAITTYLRRQTYSLLGVVADDDDDGNEANKAGTFQKPALKPGIGVHSPKQDVSHVPTDIIESYVLRMGLIASLDQPDEKLDEAIYELHLELNKKNHEIDGIYQASVDAMIDKKYITSQHAWKQALARHKEFLKQRAA
jgi:hypothetical protein